MANQWFKFYGMDYLNSPTIHLLNSFERSCWVTLMCYASTKDNKIEFLNEDTLFDKSGICNVVQRDATRGVLDKFVRFKMIKIDGDLISLNNFEKRQEYTMTSTERSRIFREKQRGNQEIATKLQRKATKSNARNANATLEEKRIEENRIDINTQQQVVDDGIEKQISEVINQMAKNIDPKNARFYGHKVQREACKFVIQTYGYEVVLDFIESYKNAKGKINYLPSITSPIELRDKWVKVLDSVEREKVSFLKKKKVINL